MDHLIKQTIVCNCTFMQINKMIHHDFVDLIDLTHDLRVFNEKICVVEINIKVTN
jgi:hypothetical protein